MLNELLKEKVKCCENNIEDLAVVFAKHIHKKPRRYCFILHVCCKYAGENITLNEGKARYCEKKKHFTIGQYGEASVLTYSGPADMW